MVADRHTWLTTSKPQLSQLRDAGSALEINDAGKVSIPSRKLVFFADTLRLPLCSIAQLLRMRLRNGAALLAMPALMCDSYTTLACTGTSYCCHA
jgi:hypothetical protein